MERFARIRAMPALLAAAIAVAVVAAGVAIWAVARDPGKADVAAPPSLDGQVLVGAEGFLTVGIGVDVDDLYPPGLDSSCVPPGPGYPPPGASMPDSPPVPGYLPEGFALEEERLSGGRHLANLYTSASNSYRFTVSVWGCSRISIPPEAHWELVTVARHWGILFDGACFEGSDGGCDWDPDFSRALWFETGRGYVLEIRSVVNPIDKGELLKIAESMPVFDPPGQ